jgi:hypothetical protein
MAHPAPGVLPQSGCAVIVQSHPNEAAEPSKCTKDPAFDARNAILDAIQNLTKEVRGVKNALRTRHVMHLLQKTLHPLIKSTVTSTMYPDSQTVKSTTRTTTCTRSAASRQDYRFLTSLKHLRIW